MQDNIIGWDVGGAHLKAAWLNSNGDVVAVYQEPCPLWQGLHTLEKALANILQKLPHEIKQHCLTMSGELVDLFSSRAEGVQAIIDFMQEKLAHNNLSIYAGRLGFLLPNAISSAEFDDIASANWLASASYVAKQIETGVFVDIGSTTSDVLLLKEHQVLAQGYTDFQRLKSSELVYTGVVRTAVMAVSQSVKFSGSQVGLMSEYFATMADVYRLTAELQEQADQTETADGADKTIAASANRLARMIGCDLHDFSLANWKNLAYEIRKQQLARVQQSVERQLNRLDKPESCTLIGAGIGRFLIQEIAENLNLTYLEFDSFFNAEVEISEMKIADCAPAVAVAYLACDMQGILD
ncbi:MAG: hydantoinase/oxoprolinase family protein [Methyloprofundus sp.]|nr:hydantoinase/oxoprolinase family protein [Methyloprofundus sp.]